METVAKCKAPRAVCGSASGWRVGGRCPRCRAAHNEDDRSRRGLSEAQRNAALSALRAGGSASDAANAAGVTQQSLSQSARADSELRAALDGMPEPVQAMARRADWIAALVRLGGDQTSASHAVGLPVSKARSWRQNDPDFDAVVVALLAWIEARTDRPIQNRRRIPDRELDMAAAQLEAGVSVREASRRAGISSATLIARSEDHERLRAALKAAREDPMVRRRNGMSKESVGRLPELWMTPGMTVAQIGEELGVSGITVRTWSRKLGLPPRR